MVRIILEDIKSNKEKKNLIVKREIASSPGQTVKKYAQEEIKKDKEIEKENESKIDEYFKSRSREKPRLHRTPQIKTKSKILHKPILIIFIVCVIVGGIYWGGNIFQKANITITSKHQIITYDNKQFVAGKDQGGNAIDFEIMITPDKKQESVILTDSKDVSIKAEGSVTLYNEFSANPQKLLAGTFLSDDSGKTYKTDAAVTIPGYTKDNNKIIIPGQVVVNISSFLAGDSYNGAPTDFYVNSFKGTTKYNKIYGKLESPISGGASGTVYMLDDINKKKIINIAESSFKNDLLKKVKAQVPPGYILYPRAMTFSYIIGDNILSKTPTAEVAISGVLSVVLLKEESLMDNIIKVSLPNIKGNELKEIKISDLSNLSFIFTNIDQLITKDMNSVSFALSGSVDAVWNPDIEILKTKLIGISKDNVLPIFGQDPGIASALVKISPPWQKYIPNNLSRINIITK